MDGIKKMQWVYEQELLKKVEDKITELIAGYQKKINAAQAEIESTQKAIKAMNSSCENHRELMALYDDKWQNIQFIRDLKSVLDYE